MTRILSESGNVIAADFRPEPKFLVQATSRILFADDSVILGRYDFYYDGKLTSRNHYLIDIDTGATRHL